MSESCYVLGQSEFAARRLELQDRHFAAPSEALLDALALRPADRVPPRCVAHFLRPDRVAFELDGTSERIV